MRDEDYMKLALMLAERGCGRVNPNPMVGAVIVRDGQIIGSGWHEAFGGPHAERNALSACCGTARGAVMYVTLEPCCHQGKTPPCTEAIIESGVRRVAVGVRDPNPLVAGRGIQRLRECGIEVTEGILEEECQRMNRVFFHYVRTGRPYVVMKYAMTLDGKIASASGASKWITGEIAREHVHRSRNRYAAVTVGVGTVLADDPMLNCRISGGRNPVRVICDTRLRTPLDSSLVRSAKEIPLWIATSCGEEERQEAYREAGCRLLMLPMEKTAAHLDWKALMELLGQEGIDSVLLEGGGELNASALESGMVNRIQAYVAPMCMGGRGAPGPVGGSGADTPFNAVHLEGVRVEQLGADLLIEGEVKQGVYGTG